MVFPGPGRPVKLYFLVPVEPAKLYFLISLWFKQDSQNTQKTEGAHFLKAFWGENLRKNREKTATATEHREMKGLTFLVQFFLIFLFYSKFC